MEQAIHTVLVGDDSDDDRLFLRRLLRRLPEAAVVAELRDGEEVIAYLAAEPPPRLLILDLKMPRKDGHDVLRWLRDHPRPIDVVILSGSSLAADMERSLALGARAYHVKSALPRDQEAFLAKLQGLLRGGGGHGHGNGAPH